jgi:uncharacterized membrane protein YfcA
MNALKMLCNSVANGIAVLAFILARAVYWKEGLIMLMVATVGGYLGGAWSRKLNPRLLRMIVVVSGLCISGYYFWKLG